jgi:hypothetical protein
LTDILPKANYNNDDDDRRGKYSQSIKTKSSSKHVQQNARSINLPKLDRLLLKNGVSKIPLNHSIEKEKISLKPYQIDSSILKI